MNNLAFSQTIGASKQTPHNVANKKLNEKDQSISRGFSINNFLTTKPFRSASMIIDEALNKPNESSATEAITENTNQSNSHPQSDWD